jgi:hypothetical protein
MDWIFNHLWVVIVIAGLVAKVLQAVRGKPPAAGKGVEPAEKVFEDPDLAERTRKIREEIRRKIEERRGQTGQATASLVRPKLAREDRSPQATPPPVVLELPPMIRKMLTPVPTPATAAAPVDPDAAAELARQAELAEQLRQVIALKTGTGEERRAAFASSIADKEQVALAAGRGALLDDLRDPAALRRAFVLREVLGPPVALRN